MTLFLLLQDSCSVFICVWLTPQTVIILTQGGSDVVEAREQVAGPLALVSPRCNLGDPSVSRGFGLSI